MSTLPIGRRIQRGERFALRDVASDWQQRRDAILASYETTHSYKRTALEFGISYQRVQQIVKRCKAAS